MFTDGLNTSDLQWVRKEQAARTGSTPRTCTTPASGKGSPDITRYDYPKPTRTRGLPPPQLSNVHLHSHALRPPFAVDDDLDESVGSISGGHHRYDDYDDSGDEQESGLYSPSDTSPSGDSAHVVVITKPLIPDHAEVEDYYDGPLSRKNSSKDGSSLKRDVSGRRDSSGRKDVDNVSLGGRHVDSGLSRKNSFDMRDGRNVGSGLSRKNSFDMRDGRNVGSGLSRKNSFDMRDGRNVGSGLSRKNSFDMRDGRDGAYADSGRFDPYYVRREETLERHGAYTGSGRFDPNYGRAARVVDGAKYHSSREDQLMSSATELSDDTVDTEDDSEEEQQRQPLRRAPVVKVQAAVSYPKIEGYEPVKTENRPAKKEVEIQVSRQRWTATASMPIRMQNSTQQLQSRSPRECLEADKLPQPAADKVGSSSMQSSKANEPVVPHPPPSTTGGPPSAPPFFDAPGAPEPSADAPGGSSIGGSYVTSYEQRSTCEPSVRSVSTTEEPGISSQYRGSSAPPARPAPSLPPPLPVYHSGQAAWQALVAYDACVRLCLRAWARGCMEAPEFLLDECSLLRNCFGLQQLLLQPHEEGSRKGVSEELGDSGAPPIQKRSVGRVKVQVRKLKIMSKPQPFRSSSMSALDTNAAAPDFEGRPHAQRRSLLSSGWSAVRKMRIVPKQGARPQSGAAQQNSSQRSMAYVNAGAQYVRQVSGMLKDKVSSLRHSALAAEVPQENFTCLLRLRSTPEQDALRLQPGSGETSILLPENPNDDLFLDLHDMKGNFQGRMTVHVASISDDPSDRVRWYNIYCEPEHECVGKVQLFVSYTVTSGEVDSAKWGPVGETKAYDIVLEVAMRVQQFQRRKLRLEGTWLWLLSEFASCYGVSVSYTKLRYLVCIMEVATPTEDCLVLIHDLLCPIIKARDENSLNRQEKRLLVDVQEQVEQLLAVVFENYKSLDEDSISGLADSSAPVCGFVAPALIPAVQIYTLLHDILSVGAAETLRNYFKAAAMKRCKRLMMETDEFVASNNEGFLMDPLSMSSAYQKMRTLCLNVRSEVRADIEIHNKHVLPSSIDLPNIAASIYDMELANRLRAFLVACPPSGPSPPVAELMLSTADFQQDLVSWRIRTQRGVNVKELFHLYIVLWIQDKRLHLLDLCKFDKERCTWVTTQHTTSPSVEEVYDRIKDTLNEYEVIINRWPEYTVPLESAVADVERAVIGALEKQYSEVLLPLKDVMIPKKFSLQYMQKLTRRQKPTIYSVPSQLGVMLNSLKRLLDTLRPRIEAQMKTWVACLPEQGGGSDRVVFGERLNEVTIELRAKYKNYLQSIVEKLADNARLQRTTKLKKILQDTREAGGESDIRERMQPLNTQLVDTISHLHDVFTTRVFVAVCRGFWDRMARDVLHFLENRKGNRSWYKGSSFALGILDDVFATQMQRLQGRALQEKDLEPPRSVAEARSMLSRDAHNGTDSSSLFFY